MPPELSGSKSDPIAELAEAEADEAQALAEAALAQERAEALRGEVTGEPAGPARGRWAGSAAKAPFALAGLAAGAAVVLTVLMVSQHSGVAAQRARDAEIVEAARASITALLSIDHTRARADVQRVIELSTGGFRDDFAKSADDFVKTAEDKDVITKGAIKAAALESSESDRGVVLMAVNSEVTNSNGAREDPRPFRMSVTMDRDGEMFKMSNLEFVP